VNIIDSHESRITGVKVRTANGSLSILNVYMPTENNDYKSLEAFIDCLCNLHAIIVHCNAANVIIAGDFNSGIGSHFHAELEAFVNDNHLIISDVQHLMLM